MSARPPPSARALFALLPEKPGAADRARHAERADLAEFTKRIREVVPLIDFCGFEVVETAEGRGVVDAPLLERAMNQNGTHQAAVFYLLADCVLPVAVFGALPGLYVAGVHDRGPGFPVQFWTKRGEVKHLAAGTGRLRATVTLGAEELSRIRSALRSRGHTDVRYTVPIHQGDRLVATVDLEMGVYGDAPRMPGEEANVIQALSHNLSALLIAGLRPDPESAVVAGEQGRALARRMARSTPQLPGLIVARTEHLEGLLQAEGTFEQMCLVGLGLDTKPARFDARAERFFGVDLPPALRNRERRMRGLHDPVLTVPADVRAEGWHTALLEAGFDPSRRSLFVVEGLSMYLERPDVDRLLKTLRSLAQHPGSRLWIDHVTPALLAMDRDDVRTFLRTMARFGEPFVTGAEDLSGEHWCCAQLRTAAEVLAEDEPVHREYRFSVLAPR